jgi:hypothetical protein
VADFFSSQVLRRWLFSRLSAVLLLAAGILVLYAGNFDAACGPMDGAQDGCTAWNDWMIRDR